MLTMSGDSANIPREKLSELKTEVSSTSLLRRDISPPPCVKKRRRYNEACGSLIGDGNMASQSSNTGITGSIEVPASSSTTTASSSGSQSSSPSSLMSPSQGQIQLQKTNNFEPLDKSSSNTLKVLFFLFLLGS